MSFGFKKNKNLASSRKHNTLNVIGEDKEEQKKVTIISNLNVINEANNFTIADESGSDNNGNITNTGD